LRLPPAGDRRLEAERGTLRLILRVPEAFTPDWNGLSLDDFTDPAYRALFTSVLAAADGPQPWTQRVQQANPDPVLDQLVVTLAVEPILREATTSYAAEYAALLRVQTLARQIAELKSKLQRTNPIENQARYNRMFADLVELEKSRKELLAVVTGPAA
jgi:DNA primase